MPQTREKMRVAIPAWEIGRVESGLGAKIGGLGGVIEELPVELVKAAAKQNTDLEIEILSPCFGHYDRRKLTKVDIQPSITINGETFELVVYEYLFPDGLKVVYFWDEWQLNWTHANSIYPSDPLAAFKLFGVINQAMARYIEAKKFDTVHLHDYHVGLIPFYLNEEFLANLSLHFTIHNATYQGRTRLSEDGVTLLNRLGLPGEQLFYKYFEFFGELNPMKACLLKVHESGGKITTVSGDIEGTWGYAAELKESHEKIWEKAQAQKGSPPGQVFVPNQHLNLFEKLPIVGITNGMSDQNRPENLPELKVAHLQAIQKRRGANSPLFTNPTTQTEMLAKDHNFDLNHLEVKAELRRLLHLEAFGHEPHNNAILFTGVGRLVSQKNFALVADVIERVFGYDDGAKFIILAAASPGDNAGQALESKFFQLAARYPHRVYFNNTFNKPLSKLILTGGDFCLIPSRFEPCGLVDYEASLVGNIVVGRATGGLNKVRHCAYLYEWLDVSDYWGEANAFYYQIKFAIDNYRHHSVHHERLIELAMTVDASWDNSADQYVHMYRYGHLVKQWKEKRYEAIGNFIKKLGKDRDLFTIYFSPAQGEFSDDLDWRLRATLDNVAG